MPDGPFSLICCRNLVFTYFADSLQRRLLRTFLARLRPGGVLMLGTGEALPEGAWPLTHIEEDLPLYRHHPD